MENDLKTNNAIDETNSSPFPIFTEEEEFVYDFIIKQCDYYSQKVIAIFDVLQTYIKKVYGIDTEISPNDIEKFSYAFQDKAMRNTPDHYLSKKHLGAIRGTIKNTFYFEVKEYIAEFEKKSVLIFRNNIIDKSNHNFEIQNLMQLLYEVKNVRNTRKLFSDYGIEIDKLLPDSKEFILSDEEEYYFRKWLYNLDNSLNRYVSYVLDTLETKLNSDIEYLKESEVLPQDPATKTPKEFKYFKKGNGKYHKEANCTFTQIAYCLNVIGNNAGEGIVTDVKNSKVFNFSVANYNSMKTYIKNKNFGKSDEADTKDLMQELKQILKEAKII